MRRAPCLPSVRESFLWPLLSSATFCACLAFAVNTSAYTAEIIAGSLRATPNGEIEAAKAMGMSRYKMYRQPVRSIKPFSNLELLLEATHSPETSFIPRLEAVAQQCIAEGADVILVGCAYYGPLLRRIGYRQVTGTQVPVVDSSTVALKYLEAMVGIAQCSGVVKC